MILHVYLQKPDWVGLDMALHQHFLSVSIDEAVYTAISCHQHRACPWPSPHAGDWLNGVPPAALGLLLCDQEFHSCLRYWLGVSLHSTAYSCPTYKCHAIADPFGDHQIGCGGNGDRIARHNAIHDVLYNAAQSLALGPSKEVPHLVSNSLSISTSPPGAEEELPQFVP